jgi:hypothetical protein
VDELAAILAEWRHIRHQGERLMSTITDYVAKVEASFTEIAAAEAAQAQKVTDLSAQVAALQAQIAASASTLAPADQAALDKLVADANTLATTGALPVPAAPAAPATP